MIHHGTRTRIIPILLFIIVTSISLGKCAPAVTKSLAPIWLPDDPINGNRHGSTGLWNTRSSDTTTDSNIKSDPPTIRHISRIPVEEMYDLEDWQFHSLPFSILYVNSKPRRRLASRSMANSLKAKKSAPLITTTTKPTTARPTSRSRGQRLFVPRYPLIPELFMSYGWRGWEN